jgi:hypothetical protein
MLRSIRTSRTSLGDLLAGEEVGAEREEVIDLLFEHATGTRLSLVRSREQLAHLHAETRRRLGAELTGGLTLLADAFAASVRGADDDAARDIALAARAFAMAARRGTADPFGAAVAATYLGAALDLSDRQGLALDAYADAYALYQAAEFRALKARAASGGFVGRHLAGWPILGDLIQSGPFYDALWRWCDAAERIGRGRAVVRPPLAVWRPAALARVDGMAAAAARRRDGGACMLCGAPMGWLERVRRGPIHRRCTTFRA